MTLSVDSVILGVPLAIVLVALIRGYADAVATRAASTSLLVLMINLAHVRKRKIWLKVESICEEENVWKKQEIVTKRTKKKIPPTVVEGHVLMPNVNQRGTDAYITIIDGESAELVHQGAWCLSNRRPIETFCVKAKDIHWLSLEAPEPPLASIISVDGKQPLSLFRAEWAPWRGGSARLSPDLLRFLSAASAPLEK
jgi:hypothetical protein